MFFVNRSEIEGRLDSEYYRPDIAKLEKVIRQKSTKKLADFAYFMASGGTPNVSEENYYSDEKNGIPFLRVQNLTEQGVLDLNGLKYISKDVHENMLKRSQFDDQDLLIQITGLIHGIASSVPPLGFVGNINQHIVVLKTGNRKISEYLANYLNLNVTSKLAIRRCSGGTRPALDYSALRSIPIIENIDFSKWENAKIQAQSIQKQSQTLLNSISDYLLEKLGITVPQVDNSLSSRIFICQSSELFGMRWDAENKQGKYKRLYHNLQNGKFSVAHLGSLIEFIESGSRPSGGISDISEGVLSLGGEHISQKMTLDVKTPKFISIDFHHKHLETEIQLNDILLVKDGATTGKVAIVEHNEFVGQNINEHLFMMRFSKDVNPHFVLYFLYSEIGQRQIQHGITGATVTGITKSVVKNLKIPLPDIETQKDIVAHINQIRKQAQSLEQQAKDLLQQTQQEIEKMILGND